MHHRLHRRRQGVGYSLPRSSVRLAGVAVLVAVAAVSIIVYIVVRTNLHDQIDDSLRHRTIQGDVTHDASTAPLHVPLAQDGYMQVVDREGEIITAFDDRPLPVTPEVLAVARGDRDDVFFDATIDGTPVRVHATSTGEGAAVEVGRSLAEVEQALRHLVWALAIISLGAVGLAALIGRLVAAAAYGFMAALSFTVIPVGLLASLRPAGWKLTALTAGLLPAVLGVDSLLYPDAASSTTWALAAITWGIAFIAVATLDTRAVEPDPPGRQAATPERFVGAHPTD